MVAAFAVNELSAATRDRLLPRLLSHAERGGRVLVVEPLAGFVAPWWPDWQRAFQSSGGRADEWRTPVSLPPIVEKLDRAAGLNHRELTGRSLSLGAWCIVLLVRTCTDPDVHEHRHRARHFLHGSSAPHRTRTYC